MRNNCRKKQKQKPKLLYKTAKIDEKQLQKQKQKRKPLQENKEQLKNSAAKVDPTDYLKLQRRSLQKKAR